MAHRMQAARTDEELAAIIRVFVPRVLPQIPGALFVHNNSRNLLVPTATWGGLELAQGNFAPEECWALRRGQAISSTRPARTSSARMSVPRPTITTANRCWPGAK
jgi:hypothetical protein